MRAGKQLILLLLPLLGLLLAGCEPTGQRFNIVDRLMLANGVLYARVSEDCSFGKGCYLYLSTPDQVFASRDLGQTWTEDKYPASAVLTELKNKPTFPKTVCLPSRPQTCYLLTGKGQIEESGDGSKTWKTVWQAPQERIQYMERNTPLLTVRPSTTPTDLVVFDSGSSYMVIVALGNQGVLLRKPTGEWVQAPLAEAKPVPIQAASLIDAIRATQTELIAAFVLIFFATPFFVILHILFPRLSAAWWTPILLLLIAWTCFLLWAFNLIPDYQAAIIAAVGMDLATLSWQIARNWQQPQPEPVPQTTNGPEAPAQPAN